MNEPGVLFHHSPLEICSRVAIGLLVLALVFVPIWRVLKPNPWSYISFVRSVWNVRIDNDPTKPRWLPQYYLPVFASYFLGQAVNTNLHYPLLIDKLGASVWQVGCLDAASQLTGACLDVGLRSGPWRHLTRSKAFLFHALIYSFGYGVVVGYIVPQVSDTRLALLLVAGSQTFDSLQLAFSEFGVMRADAREDILESEDVVETWRNPGKVVTKLGQLQVVLRYPAVLLASLIFSRMLSHIFEAYLTLGVLGCCVGLWQAYSWCGLSHEEEEQEDTGRSSNASHSFKDDLTSGDGKHVRLLFDIGVFNALSQVVRNGFPRMINLTALTLEDVPARDVGVLLAVVFSISLMFFWVSDIGSKGRDQYEASRARKYVGLLSFALLGLGHFLMGLAQGFKGLLVACIFFGFGQAMSTGLRTVWKDEVRAILRAEGYPEAYRKEFLRVLASLGGATQIVNSLLVGFIGDKFGMSYASIFYSVLAVAGFVWTLRVNVKLMTSLQQVSNRFGVDIKELVEEDSGGLDLAMPRPDSAQPLLDHWHESAGRLKKQNSS
eukprot:TRINITY_DN30494_c0_g1_i1.p1 TRINITY_DN30494_c0_g1~~TRINITY_DN30494_c0_g1_i1.p1  ORF type:complete len:549 (-),score=61.31 TRINITY_DN30494_c0_g1_i1:324-1970(-)